MPQRHGATGDKSVSPQRAKETNLELSRSHRATDRIWVARLSCSRGHRRAPRSCISARRSPRSSRS
jgi:hypothetical protein